MGLPGCMTRSEAPVWSSTKRTFFQLAPPSVVRKTPRVAFGFQTLPSTATKTVFGSCGSISTFEICPASPSPMKRQEAPASDEK